MYPAMDDIKEANILVVDDTPANLHLLEDILSAEQYNVRTLPSGALALRSAQSNPPDLILLDIKMPGMNGYEVCAKLKEEERTRDIPVIFISALREAEDKMHAFAAGGVDYVSKPFQSEEVLARVATHLRLSTLQKSLLEARQQAEAANRAKSAFLANMSHELRTPLNTVLGFAQLMEMDTKLNERVRSNARNIRQSGSFLLELINDILDLAKIEAGRFECFPENWQTHAFLSELKEIFRARANHKGLVFRYEETSPLPAMLRFDPRRLRQVLMNLLDNALKSTHQGSVLLYAGFNRDNNILELDIKDTGRRFSADIPAEVPDHLCQTVREKQNIRKLGLALAISKKLVEAMGGKLSITTMESGENVFHLEIPVETVETVERENTGGHVPFNVKSYRRTGSEKAFCALVCDSLDDNRKVLAELLDILGFEVLEAGNGEECLALAERKAPDIIMVDMFLDDISGAEMAERLRKLPNLQNIPWVAVSADASLESHEQALADGYHDFLDKPVQIQKLLKLLAGLLPLEWQYQSSYTEVEEEIRQLSPTQAQTLEQVLEGGDLEEMLELLEQFKSASPHLTDKLYGLVQNIDLSGIEKIIDLLKQQALSLGK